MDGVEALVRAEKNSITTPESNTGGVVDAATKVVPYIGVTPYIFAVALKGQKVLARGDASALEEIARREKELEPGIQKTTAGIGKKYKTAITDEELSIYLLGFARRFVEYVSSNVPEALKTKLRVDELIWIRMDTRKSFAERRNKLIATYAQLAKAYLDASKK